MTESSWEEDPLRIYHDKETDRLLFQIHYSILEPERVAKIRALAPKYGGFNSALWRADQELDLEAQPGEAVFKYYGPHNIADVRPNFNPKLPHIMSADFGHVKPTAIYCAQITPRQIQVYYEHYIPGVVPQVHKPRLLNGLVAAFPWLEERLQLLRKENHEDQFFDLWQAVGDPAGVEYMGQYHRAPFPIRFGNPSTEKNYRDRGASEAYLDSLFKPQKRCCYQPWPDELEKCPECSQPLKVLPGLVFDKSCVWARREFPAQVEDEDGKRAKVEDHAVDSLRYMTMRARSMKAVPEKPKEETPWWYPKRESSYSEEVTSLYGDGVIAEAMK